ncbi:MAG: hypothetical protein N2651_00335 [Fimbriimonadales bacterium]|nr:hypothetical protein [Fimbriimonadales bacterium]
MQRWAVRGAQWLSVVWATFFLLVSLLHPLTHNPLQHHSSDCFVCVLQKTHSPEPPTLHDALQSLRSVHWQQSPQLLVRDACLARKSTAFQPLIPRAPPA